MPRRSPIQLPPIRSAALVLAVAMVVTSVVAAIFRPTLWPLLLLFPGKVIHDYFLFQVFTYAFVESSPLGVIFGAIILYSIGGALEYAWGTKRLVQFALGVTVSAAVATVLLALGWKGLQSGVFAGASVMSGSIWVAYGLHNGPRQMNFWGMPVTGNIFALIGAGFIFLSAAFNGLSSVLPGIFALGFTWLYLKGISPDRLWLRFRSWQLERDLRKRSKRLKVVGGERRNMPEDSDRYLH